MRGEAPKGMAAGEAADLCVNHRPVLPTAPLSTVLSNRFGHRFVVMAGGVLVSTGMVTASFARTVADMYVTIGLVSGELSPSQSLRTPSRGFQRALPGRWAGAPLAAGLTGSTGEARALRRSNPPPFPSLLVPVISPFFQSGLGAPLTSAARELCLAYGGKCCGLRALKQMRS